MTTSRRKPEFLHKSVSFTSVNFPIIQAINFQEVNPTLQLKKTDLKVVSHRFIVKIKYLITS